MRTAVDAVASVTESTPKGWTPRPSAAHRHNSDFAFTDFTDFKKTKDTLSIHSQDCHCCICTTKNRQVNVPALSNISIGPLDHYTIRPWRFAGFVPCDTRCSAITMHIKSLQRMTFYRTNGKSVKNQPPGWLDESMQAYEHY